MNRLEPMATGIFFAGWLIGILIAITVSQTAGGVFIGTAIVVAVFVAIYGDYSGKETEDGRPTTNPRP